MDIAQLEEKIRSKIRETGEDPFYLVDLETVCERHRKWTSVLPGVQPHYAVKCNPCPPILHTLDRLGASFDCASREEIDRVLDMGVDPSRIIFANPCKMVSHIQHARLRSVRRMTFDNEDELLKVSRTFPDAELVLRIVTDDSSSLCQFSSKFGARLGSPVRSILELARCLRLNVIGVSFHVGSGCGDPAAFARSAADAREVFRVAEEVVGLPRMRLLDIGGGFQGVDDAKPSLEEIARVLLPELAKFPEGTEFIAEPGRYYATKSHTLVANVHSRRVVRDENDEVVKVLYYINEGVYHSLNCIIFDHQHPIPRAVPAREDPPDGPPKRCYPSTVFGPTCDSMDCVVKDMEMPMMEVGDWVYFLDMGAYTNAALTRFNGFTGAISAWYTWGSKFISDVCGEMQNAEFPGLPSARPRAQLTPPPANSAAMMSASASSLPHFVPVACNTPEPSGVAIGGGGGSMEGLKIQHQHQQHQPREDELTDQESARLNRTTATTTTAAAAAAVYSRRNRAGSEVASAGPAEASGAWGRLFDGSARAVPDLPNPPDPFEFSSGRNDGRPQAIVVTVGSPSPAKKRASPARRRASLPAHSEEEDGVRADVGSPPVVRGGESQQTEEEERGEEPARKVVRRSQTSAAAGARGRRVAPRPLGKAASMLELAELSGRAKLLDELEFSLEGATRVGGTQETSLACALEVARICSESPREAGLLLRSHSEIFGSLTPMAESGTLHCACAAAAMMFLAHEEAVNAGYASSRFFRSLASLLCEATEGREASAQLRSPQKGTRPERQQKSSLLMRACGPEKAAGGQSQRKACEPSTKEKARVEESLMLLLARHPAVQGVPADQCSLQLLALQCLLALTKAQCSATERIRESCRSGGVIDAVVRTLRSLAPPQDGEEDTQLRVRACLDILEGVTLLNAENQAHAVTKNSLVPLVSGLVRSAEPGSPVSCAALRVLVNLTEGNESACLACSQCGGLAVAVDVFGKLTSPTVSDYDSALITLGLLINLSEHCAPNREALRTKRVPADGDQTLIQHVAGLFKGRDDRVDQRVFASYCAILLGCLVRDNPCNRKAVEAAGVVAEELAAVIKEFMAFQSNAGILSVQAHVSCTQVVESLTPQQQPAF